MALDKSALETAIQAVIDGLPADVDAYVKGICDAIDTYLADIELDPIPTAGINPGPPPVTDPDFATASADQPVTPTTPLKATLFRAAFDAAAKLTLGPPGGPRDYAACKAQFQADIATLAELENPGGYTVSGATVCAEGPDVNAALDQGLTDNPPPEDAEPPPEGEPPPIGKFAKKLAQEIHDATTGSTFTGAYVKDTFVQQPPTPPYSSSLK